MIGTMALALLVAGCGRRDAPPAAPEPSATPTKSGPVALPESPTVAAIKRRGRLNCGVNQGLVGFAYTDNRGQWRGFDVDFCRATAAAVLGDADAVRFVPLSTTDRFDALNDGRIDVLWRNSSWTMTRDAGEGFVFAGVNYYDGQGFLVRRSLNLNSATELTGARVCVQSGSTSQANAADYFRARGIEYRPVVFDTEEAARDAYNREDCDAFSADISALAAARTVLSNPNEHVILSDVASKEPLGPVLKAGDERWAATVRWTLNALMLAEELGVTREGAADLAKTATDPRVRRLLGAEGDFGPMLGLSKTWARDAVSAVGNYGEIFERNLGSQSALDLDRGLNAQWNARPAGLIYGLPIR
ncbi:MAG: amino acid ABC transporter substrate-binding protein [Candidatus Brevundimonas colombiensis]|uniref:Amino acid ABC transporter substrate-binding protein n=1 Tax=Candidatus Brevundimonas colombiensis TaxID=3121376 RepID=A0AAJ5WZF7_9CAUL|nr:amino acid ABC transporter substrate-binding protein [Brevundimonas sp.]WEK39383.1 MAG: amino acid ABC transporter substrate-binding protein [Brevundimonas sp.]